MDTTDHPRMWTPFQMRIVLHHYGSSAECPHSNAPIYPETIDRLKGLGVLEDRESGADGETPYQVTAKGMALVEMWCAQPLPVPRFVDPRFEEARHND